jgi:NAD(P)H-dependent FMN reductase
MRIEIIAGSPRKNSLTQRLALYLKNFFIENTGHEIGLIDLREHPLSHVQKVITSPDDAPVEIRDVAQRMFNADAFIIVTPEFNGSYSPAMQNLFDHFPKQHHKIFGLATASPGALGGLRAAMPQVDKKFDADGNLLDPSFQKSIDTFVKEFLWLAEKLVAEKVSV